VYKSQQSASKHEQASYRLNKKNQFIKEICSNWTCTAFECNATEISTKKEFTKKYFY